MKKTFKPYYSAVGFLKTNFGLYEFLHHIYIFISWISVFKGCEELRGLLCLNHMGFFGISNEAVPCQITKAYEQSYLI